MAEIELLVSNYGVQEIHIEDDNFTFDADYGMHISRSRRTSEGRDGGYEIDRAEVADALGGLEDAGALGLLREYLNSLEESLDDNGQETL